MTNGKCIDGYTKLPEEVRIVGSRQATAADHYGIFEIEAVSPALILQNWLHHFTPGALWLHLLEAALATLVKGGSSVLCGEFYRIHACTNIQHWILVLV